jgi:hypothetical protein
MKEGVLAARPGGTGYFEATCCPAFQESRL